ncbi:hypothetical protein E8L99_10780 [Phreatobacter aquaticus]|jgi:uncharacterized protein YcfJ|uniref:Glycine zipper domain-containing protein n=1 Tax=Phreatobacter aquaticus TaxID=2570229 RepID=A0A4D7QLG9_9HYPH|nr:glycine zipper domain-containing protein [Phreatobacter aquaticus]QCK86204.1 hypothetical protein E8L99_10780 [Phreatobacter aquaticus]
MLKKLILVSAVALTLGACTAREERAAGGAAIGAGAGALIGGLATGTGGGALAGAAIGGVAGAVIGAETTPRRRCWIDSYGYRRCRR